MDLPALAHTAVVCNKIQNCGDIIMIMSLSFLTTVFYVEVYMGTYYVLVGLNVPQLETRRSQNVMKSYLFPDKFSLASTQRTCNEDDTAMYVPV